MSGAIVKLIENVCVGDQLVEHDGALLCVTAVEREIVRRTLRVIVSFKAFGPSPGGQLRRNAGTKLYVVPALTAELAVEEPASVTEEALAKARADLLAVGFSESEIETPTGFGLRSLPICPAVAPLVMKVAAGALSIQGALRTRRGGDR